MTSFSPLLVAVAVLASSDEPVARVDGRTVSGAQLAARMQAVRSAGGNAEAELLVQDLVNEDLLAEEAERRGLGRDPAVVARLEAERRRFAAELFVEREVTGAVSVDDELLRSMFHTTADAAHLQLLVFATREQAQGARDRIAGGGSFAAEAKAALNAAKTKEGDLGTVTRGQIDPALVELAFGAPLKQPFGPVELRLGWAVASVLERTIGSDKEFDERKASIAAFAKKQVAAQARSHYVAQLRKAAGARLDEAFIQSTGARTEFGPDELQHVVATVRGRQLRWSDVVPDVQRLVQGRQGSHMAGAAVKLQVASQRLDAMLLEDAALERGFGEDPGVGQRLARVRRELLAGALARELRGAVPAPADAEVEAEYRGKLSQFREPSRRTCSHVVAATKNGADGLRKQIAGGDPFEAVAASFSMDGSTAGKGGLLGELTDDRVDALAAQGEKALAKAIRELPANEVSAPVKSGMGWHLLRCGPRVEGRTAPLDEVKGLIASTLRRQRGDDAVRARIAELRRGATIDVDAKAVKRVASAK